MASRSDVEFLNLQNVEKTSKPLKPSSEQVYMAFPGSEPIQFDQEKLFLLAVSDSGIFCRSVGLTVGPSVSVKAILRPYQGL